MDKQTYLNRNVLSKRSINEIDYFLHGVKVALINNGNFPTSMSTSYEKDDVLNESFYENNIIIEKNKPSWNDVETAIQEVKDFWNSQNYARARNYPELGEQLDMLYKDLLAGKLDASGSWAIAIKKIKDDNPKE